jgi:para-nitrobenzyl esterase
VCLHVASPKSRGLFHSAISESGGCTTYQPTAADAEANSAKLAAQLGCTGSDTIGCMRKRSVKELFDAVTATGVSFGPNVDGDLFPVQPRALFDAQNIAQVPYILGTNTDEGTLFTTAYASIDNEDDYHAVLKKNFTASIEDICEAYSLDQFKDSPNKYQASLARIFGDARLVCPTYDTAVRASNAGSNVWLYNFDIPANMGNLGATHGSELVYVFGTGPSLNAVQRDVSDLIQSYWSNLAKFGNPNDTALYAWPKFSEKDNVRVNLGLDATIAKDFRAPECEFWRKEYDKRFVAAAPATPN